MKITWIGHSCFSVEEEGYTVVLDPYENGSVPGLKDVNEKADLVLCSHEHGDHNARGNVERLEGNAPAFEVSWLDTYHDDVKGAKRGPNRIHILKSLKTGKRLAHLGDLGCPLTETEAEALQGMDVLLVPVGGFFTIDYLQAADIVQTLNPRIAVPMHFCSDKFGFDVIDKVDRFALTEDKVRECPYSTIDTDLDYAARVVILTPKNL